MSLSTNIVFEGITAYAEGGTDTSRETYPYMVAIKKIKIISLWCGGSIISELHILTQASCTM